MPHSNVSESLNPETWTALMETDQCPHLAIASVPAGGPSEANRALSRMRSHPMRMSLKNHVLGQLKVFSFVAFFWKMWDRLSRSDCTVLSCGHTFFNKIQEKIPFRNFNL